MNILHSARLMLSPIHKEGYPFIALFFVLAVILGFFWQPLFWAGLGVTAWCAYFFRNPQRVVPLAVNVVLSPADGKVSFAGAVMPPEKLGLPQREMFRISIFMDIFSCHVNRIPVSGVVRAINYHEGHFFNAVLDKAGESNEANSLLLQTAYGEVGVVQIAGLVARRIVCWVKKGDSLAAGGRFGLIRFGSRLDVYLPLHTEILVGVGQKMVAGETVLARFAAAAGNTADSAEAAALQADNAPAAGEAEAAPGTADNENTAAPAGFASAVDQGGDTAKTPEEDGDKPDFLHFRLD